MEKTIDERLFEQLMRAPHVLRRAFIESDEGEHRGPHCRRHEGPHGPTHGPMGGHGPQAGHPMPGLEHGPGHGPMHGRGPNPAFARERLLGIIGSYEGGVRQKTLVEELRINPSSVSEIISKLESDGYVKREVDPDDKRATLISLTELGTARAAELEDERKEQFSRAFGNLTDEEKEQLLALLEKLTAEK